MYALNQVHNTHTIRHRTHRRDGTGGAMEKLEPNYLIVFPHRYRRDGTHRRDRTGGANKREGKFISKLDRARCYPLRDYVYLAIWLLFVKQRTTHASAPPAYVYAPPPYSATEVTASSLRRRRRSRPLTFSSNNGNLPRVWYSPTAAES